MTVPAETDTPEVRIGRGGALNLATQAIGLGTSFLVGVIIARVLGVEGKGLLAIVMQVPAVLLVILDLGLATANVYFVSKGVVRAGVAAANSLVIAIAFGFVGAPVIYALLVGPLKLTSGVPVLAAAFAIAVLPSGLFASWLMGITAGVGRLGLLFWSALASSVTTLAGLATLLITGTGGVSGVVGGSLAGTLVGLAVVLFGLRHRLRPFRPDVAVARSGMAFSIRVYATNIASYLLNRQDVLLLGWLGGVAAVGVYTVGVSFAELTWYIPNALSSTIAAKGGRTSEDSGIDYVTRTTRIAVIVMGLTTALGAVFIPLLIPLIYGGAFRGAVAVFFVLLPGVLINGVAVILGTWQTVRGRQYWRQSVVTMVANFVAVVLLAPTFGALGTAAASSVCYASLATFVIWRFCRDTGARAAQVVVPTREDVHVVTRTLRELSSEWVERIAGPAR